MSETSRKTLMELLGKPTRWERFRWRLEEAWELVLKVEAAIQAVGVGLLRLALVLIILSVLGGLGWLAWNALQMWM
ncbi:MAG: hypothetical protein JWO56_2649 [Acidobacteria bacterium]|nr:hypothetical protein [Acidobacteriota bacterium]